MLLLDLKEREASIIYLLLERKDRRKGGWTEEGWRREERESHSPVSRDS